MTTPQQEERFQRLAEKRRAVDTKLAPWFGISAIANQPVTGRELGPTPSRPILAHDVSAHLAMAAGQTPANTDRIGGRPIGLELDPTDPATRWQDEGSAATWTAAKVFLGLESIADTGKLRLVFSNLEALPDNWMFAAVGLLVGQIPAAQPPPGAAKTPDPSIDVAMPTGYASRDIHRVAVYVTEVGMVVLGCLVFRVAGNDPLGHGS